MKNEMLSRKARKNVKKQTNVLLLLLGILSLTLSINWTSNVEMINEHTRPAANPASTPVLIPNLQTKPDVSRFTNYTETANQLNIEMVAVKGGTFMMGSTDEKPVHQVTLSDFYIGKYEVTQAQWSAVMGSNPSHFKGDNLPVETVSWIDIQQFITKLNRLTGKQYRLPTEAEWEFAARGGTRSKHYEYSGSNTASNVAWIDQNSDSKTHPAGTKTANESGIYDMSGNVWEWCNDWYSRYNDKPVINPKGASFSYYRIKRGGSFNYFAQHTHVAHRDYDLPDNRSSTLGFRLACSSK